MQIGDAVAIVLGTTEPAGEKPFRQNNQFFYLTGVAEPRAIVMIDGRTKKTTLFLQPKNAQREAQHVRAGAAPGAGRREGDRRRRRGRRATGYGRGRRSSPPTTATIYTPFGAEVLGEAVVGRSDGAVAAQRTQDPWDGRDSREAGVHREAEGRGAAVGRSRISIRSSTRCAP